MNKKTRWFQKHPVVLWAIISVIYAVIVHVLFSIRAPFEFLSAKWSAGEVLTYASTVALGLLAFWQNKRFKEENDRSQKRLEQLSKQSNEISIINKIIEFESENLSQTKAALDAFVEVCDAKKLSLEYIQNADSSNNNVFSSIAMSQYCDKIDLAFLRLCRVMRIDQTNIKKEKDHFLVVLYSFYLAARELAEDLYKDFNNDSLLQKKKKLDETRLEFTKESEKYLVKKEERLHKLLFENLSLEEIQAMTSK